MNAKQRTLALYNEHIELSTTNGKLFRKTIIETLMAEFGCSISSAATHYNNCKKENPVEGLGRAKTNSVIRHSKTKEELQDDNDCFSVVELVPSGATMYVGRCYSFLAQGDASEEFDDRIQHKPVYQWVMIKGLGPLHNEQFTLSEGEAEIKRYVPEVIEEVACTAD